MHPVHKIARREILDPTEVLRWFEEGDGGARIVALGLMEADRDLRDFDAAIDAIEHSRTAFEQYHGLKLAASMQSAEVAAKAGFEAGPKLGYGQRMQLLAVAERAGRSRRVRGDSDRANYVRLIERELT
jgi:hypothetical protein